MTANCWARVGELEFGPIPLDEFSQLVDSHSLPSDLELRIDSTELWWHWPSIALGTAAPEGEYGWLGNWFVRTGDDVAGPMTIADVTFDLLSGRLPPQVEIQIGDASWRNVADLLVLIPETESSPNKDEAPVVSESNPSVSDPNAISPEESRKAQLEAWFATTLPERKISVTVVPRAPTGTLDDIVAAALLRMSAEAEDVAKELSRPWIWGGLAAMSLVTMLLLIWPGGGPDELELKAYRHLKTVQEAIQAVRKTQPSEEDWKAFADEVTVGLEPIKEELSQKKRGNAPIKELLFWAVEYRLPKILQEGRLKPSPAEIHFAENLKQAKKHLDAAAR